MLPPQVITLAQFTRPSLVIPELRSSDAQAIIAELCSTLQREGQLPQLLPFYGAVLERERLCSTVAGPCLALPHARHAGLPELCFALGRTNEPLPWLGASDPMVRLIFLFAVPETEAALYLSLMSGVAKLTQERTRLRTLLTAPDSAAMLEVLEQIPVRQPRLTSVRG